MCAACYYCGRISIHAPRTGSDKASVLPAARNTHFNPRSPHGERLNSPRHAAVKSSNFNPRSPHGERQAYAADLIVCDDFNPRSPHGERLTEAALMLFAVNISIHAPRTGSDWMRPMLLLFFVDFNPRSPHGERRYLFLPTNVSLI